MATIQYSLSKRIRPDRRAEMYFYVRLTAKKNFRLKTGVFVPSECFSTTTGKLTPPRRNPDLEAEVRKAITDLKRIEADVFTLIAETPVEELTTDLFNEKVFGRQVQKKNSEDQLYTLHFTPDSNRTPFFMEYDRHMANPDFTLTRRRRYMVARRILQRFELFKQKTTTAPFMLDVRTFDDEVFSDFINFVRDETLCFELFPDIYDKVPIGGRPGHKQRAPEPRGSNTVVCLERCVRAFFAQLRKAGKINVIPFEKVARAKEHYIAPWLLTKDERDAIMNADLTSTPELAVQRDIFIFQCLTGCRVSDLIKLTPNNVEGGRLVYVPTKTETKTGAIATVPLIPAALEIIKRHEGNRHRKGRLLPCITPQRYNDAIKRILTVCGIDRPVARLNSKTGTPEMRPACEVASSHLARRTFVGLLYKGVKDPNIISKMSGHVEGSKAFARYRDIDDDILKETVNKYL